MEPVVCDMSAAPDTLAERWDAYARLLADACVARERTALGMRWVLRAGQGVEERARELAARESACCRFLTIAVTSADDTVVWAMTAPADVAAQEVVDLFHALPESRPRS